MAALTLDTLKDAAATGSIDTVLVALVDMQGLLMGKRFHVSNFLDHAIDETHCCNYLLATDPGMATPGGYAATSWESGYGDYVLKSDLATLCTVPWLEKTALVLGDVLDRHDHAPVPHSPRQMLQRQVERLKGLGFDAMMATELEFFLFERGFREIRKDGYRDLVPLNGHAEDYCLFQTGKEEAILRPLRNHLVAAGIPVECTKGEAETGQQELNIRFADALACADRHAIAKEIAWAAGRATSFLPKWAADKVGSGSHVQMSLWQDGEAAFHAPEAERGMSDTMRRFLAGLLAHARDITIFLTPYVNSYRRFAKGTFAPTKTVWSVDNRTAVFRLCGEGTRGVRVECRIGGSDLNPYLAQAALLAAGMQGIEDKLELQPPTRGDAHESDDVPETRGRCARRPGACAARPCCARQWGTGWTTTTPAAPSGSRWSSTAPSPTGRWPAGSRAHDHRYRPCGPGSCGSMDGRCRVRLRRAYFRTKDDRGDGAMIGMNADGRRGRARDVGAILTGGVARVGTRGAVAAGGTGRAS